MSDVQDLTVTRGPNTAPTTGEAAATYLPIAGVWRQWNDVWLTKDFPVEMPAAWDGKVLESKDNRLNVIIEIPPDSDSVIRARPLYWNGKDWSWSADATDWFRDYAVAFGRIGRITIENQEGIGHTSRFRIIYSTY